MPLLHKGLDLVKFITFSGGGWVGWWWVLNFKLIDFKCQAKLRPASLLRFLLLENFEFCKCAKLELGQGLSLSKSCLQVVNKS